MCGIAGLVTQWQGPTRNRIAVTAMIKTLEHRGPDAADVWADNGAALGHTRLAIVDLAGGTQPMTVDRGDGSLVLSFSGEIYNHDELRRQLRAAGHTFRSRSDTEVILHAHQQWGAQAPTHLRGIFAYALWDTSTNTLLLVRDRLGVKPLYFALLGGELIFGSEHKALLAHPMLPAEIDDDGLTELLAMVPMTTPGHGILRQIHEVPPATIVRYNRQGLSRTVYWQLTSHRHEHSRATTISRVRELLAAAVDEQIKADVPVGSLLSGGVDSSAVAALAAQYLGGEQLWTYDLMHAEPARAASSFHNSDDHPAALLAAEHIKSEHRTITASTADLLAAHAATRQAMDLPSLTPINASLLHLFIGISRDRRVVLSGEGADELFGGYRWHDLDAGDHQPGRFPWHSTYEPLTALLNRDTLRALRPSRHIATRRRAALEQMPLPAGEIGRDRRQRETDWLTVVFYLPFLLRRKDRLSMRAGVEARVPFLDHRLVEYAWNIPADMRPSRRMEKGVLREAVADLLPTQVAWRRKSGYPASVTTGYRDALWQQLRDVLATPRSPILHLINPRNVAAMLDRHAGELHSWTPLQHVAYLLELNYFLRGVRIR
ncbi:asparagine synthase (glutamine-hydrolyzing) [Hamadaea tsunoensis]|uniref:asparagine synthase (glutamine-hydrolyzing) n=1 Tax=Hamadaea tsunoensis TaxID=53368 RepID=UPI00040532EF|nr:asparagine synthase (glutamine-hydrolyzing) [Hamadaea tsunoensis]